jgi:uncharacterized membrane protein
MNETRRDQATDLIARILGSWGFIIGQLIILIFWLLFGGVFHDPYPFLFLNLTLGVVSSLAAPLIMMSQNRQETRDEANAEQDLATDLANAERLKILEEKIDVQTTLLFEMHHQMTEELTAALFPRRKKSRSIRQGQTHDKES